MHILTLKTQTAANIKFLEYTISMEFPGYTGETVHMKREHREYIFIGNLN